MTAPQAMPWPGSREQAEEYAGLRHPALVGVLLSADAAGAPTVAARPAPLSSTSAADRVPLAVDAALRATGEIALGLSALHELGLAHGELDPAELVDAGDRWQLSGVARPGDHAARRADVVGLGRLLAALVAPADSDDPRIATMRATATADAATAADVARTALALASGHALPTPAPVPPAAAAAPSTAADIAAADDLDRRRRRTRNRMIAVAVVVVLLGAVLLRLLDRQGIVSVPRETGRTATAAADDLRQAGLVPRLVHVPSSAGQPAGTVVTQEPAAGARVRPGRTVTLRVAASERTSAVRR